MGDSLSYLDNLLVKIENRSRKRSQWPRRNGSRKNRNVSISSVSVYDSVAYDLVKTGYRRRKKKRKNQPITRPGKEHCDWFIPLCFRLRQSSFYLIVSDGVISGMGVLLPTPSIWFSLDRIALLFWLWLRYDSVASDQMFSSGEWSWNERSFVYSGWNRINSGKPS